MSFSTDADVSVPGRLTEVADGGVTPLPVRTLVNTHHHPDHTAGNGLFTGATIVAHDNAREEMRALGVPRNTGLWTDADYGDGPRECLPWSWRAAPASAATRKWSDTERIVGNLHRAYAGLSGTGEVNHIAALTDMVTYNGGQPLTCRA